MSEATPLHLDRIQFPVHTLGPGARIGLWLEGCDLGCPGCIAPQLFRREPRHALAPAAVAELLRPLLTTSPLLTISGGEPFQQAGGLAAMLSDLRSTLAFEVLVYSGYTLAELRVRNDEARRLLSLVDLLMDGRYRAEQPTRKAWRGSDNQRLLRLRGGQQARPESEWEVETEPRLEVHYSQALGLDLTGIPAPTFGPKFSRALLERGIRLRRRRGEEHT